MQRIYKIFDPSFSQNAQVQEDESGIIYWIYKNYLTTLQYSWKKLLLMLQSVPVIE
jgi:hypothetical protein